MDKEDPFKEFIENLEAIDKIGEIEIVNYSSIPTPRNEIELYIQELIIQHGLPYNQEIVDLMVEMIKALQELPVESLGESWRYIIILLWDVLNSNQQVMSAMKLAFMYGLALGSIIDWENTS